MRLIDADELTRVIIARSFYYSIETNILNIIDNAPTVETPTIYEFKGCDNCELERPQGEWIEQTDYVGDTYYECSVCKEPWTTIEGTPMQNLMNFCPFCGADMRGDPNDG